jgi:hypothetical protein
MTAGLLNRIAQVNSGSFTIPPIFGNLQVTDYLRP